MRIRKANIFPTPGYAKRLFAVQPSWITELEEHTVKCILFNIKLRDFIRLES